MDRSTLNTKKIALSGIMGALAVVFLILAAVLPTSTLAFYALSSVFISVIIIEYTPGAGLLFYAGTSLLALALLPVKTAVLPYIIFFGLYGFVKYHIERLRSQPLEYVLKLVFFNVCLGASYLLLSFFFAEAISSRLPWWILIIGLNVVFVIYDYLYTMFIAYYIHKIKAILKT